jgi:hypothetical protein
MEIRHKVSSHVLMRASSDIVLCATRWLQYGTFSSLDVSAGGRHPRNRLVPSETRTSSQLAVSRDRTLLAGVVYYQRLSPRYRRAVDSTCRPLVTFDSGGTCDGSGKRSALTLVYSRLARDRLILTRAARPRCNIGCNEFDSGPEVRIAGCARARRPCRRGAVGRLRRPEPKTEVVVCYSRVRQRLALLANPALPARPSIPPSHSAPACQDLRNDPCAKPIIVVARFMQRSWSLLLPRLAT